MHVEFFEGKLGKVGEVEGQLARLGVGDDVGQDLHVNAEAVGDENDPVGVAGLRFAKVDVPRQGAWQGRAVDAERAHLGEFGAFGGFQAIEVLPRLPCRRPCRRRRWG